MKRKHFFTKRLPALCLALLLLGSTMPTALADEEDSQPTHKHVWDTNWTKDENSHWHVCTVEGCPEKDQESAHQFTTTSETPATCYKDGSKTETCSVCGYVRTTTYSATGAHSFSDAWTSDETSHWHTCTTPGCPEISGKAPHHANGNGIITEPTCTQAGFVTYTCETCGKTYTQKTANALGHIDANQDNRCDRCGVSVVTNVTVTFKNGSSTFNTQTIAKGSAPSNPGTPTKSGSNMTYTFKGWTTSNPGSSAAYTGQSTMSSSQVSSNKVSADTTYYAVYTVSASNKSSSFSVSGNTSGTSVGSSLRSQINNAFSGVVGSSFYMVRFTSLSNSTYGRLYTDSDKKTSVSSGTYYSYNNLSSFYFVPGSRDSFSISYTASDSYGNSVSGTVTFSVNVASSSTITYKVAPGGQVSFDRTDFNKALQSVYDNYSVRYVSFDAPSAYDSADGTIYYDYGYSDQKSFSRSTLDNYYYYYSSSSYGDYALNDLSFVAGKNFNTTLKISFRAYYSSGIYVDGTLVIEPNGSVSSSTITYEVKPGEQVSFDRADFNKVFQSEYDNYSLRYVTFEAPSTYDSADGTIYYDYGYSDQRSFSRSTLDNYSYYYSDTSYGDYSLRDLSFVAGKNFNTTLKFSFRAYYSSTRYVDGTLIIKPDGTNTKASITYEVEPGGQISFNRTDFNKIFQDEYSNYSLRYVTFTAPGDYATADGTIYYDYGYSDQKAFTRTTLDNYTFYYSDKDLGDYAINDLSFVAGRNFNEGFTLDFRAYYSSTRYVDGTLRIQPTSTSVSKGNVLYSTTYNTPVQINPNDIARFFSSAYPSYQLQYVKLENVPSTGTLYYNYYNASKYGPNKLQYNSSNCDDEVLYFSPSSTSQYSLTELTYVPSGVNYCASIPFTAYASGSRSVSGTILISVNFSAVSEVYGVTPRGSAVSFPSSAIYTAVAGSTSTALASIQLLSLPSASVGTVYVGSGTSTKATTSTRYTYASGSNSISQLRFVPANSYTGSVEIPYVAYSSTGNAIATGKFCLGVVSNIKKFSDMSSSTWCYKYVTELSDANVIDGYTDGTFRPNNTVTYGQALKLIMLAAGYSEQPKTGTHPFSGYLTRAKADGLISGNITNLDTPISRLAVAQIAAKAMKLNISGLSSVKPFTDTSDPYVQALNAAGIVEGYFANGTSTYKPNNTLTRGQISAIVWRMERSR